MDPFFDYDGRNKSITEDIAHRAAMAIQYANARKLTNVPLKAFIVRWLKTSITEGVLPCVDDSVIERIAGRAAQTELKRRENAGTLGAHNHQPARVTSFATTCQVLAGNEDANGNLRNRTLPD
jgi:hypothetical protein